MKLVVSQGPSEKISEADFTTMVVNHARVAGWWVHHDLPVTARTGRTRTAIQGDRGFPDLVLCHRAYGMLVAELKVGRNKPEEAQVEWLDRFALAGVATYLWRPRHFLGGVIPALNGEGGALLDGWWGAVAL